MSTCIEFQHAKATASQNMHVEQSEIAKVNYVALAALITLSLIGIGVPMLVFYLQTHTFADKTPQENRTELMAIVESVAGDAIKDAMLTKVADYAQEKMGTPLPHKTQIDAIRLKRKRDKVDFSILPISSDTKKIDGFIIHQDQIGSGAMSIVKTAIKLTKENGEWVAEKGALHKPKKGSEYFFHDAKYTTEILKHRELFKEATHPNIDNGPKNYGWLDNKREFMFSELADGDLKKHTFTSSEQFFSFITQIADGLRFYHRHGVVHCDLKPENILVKGDKVIVSDSEEEKEDKINGTAGSAYYYPSELTEENSKQNRKWDLYAMGLIFLDMKYNFLFHSINQTNFPMEEKQKMTKELDDSLKHTDHILAELKEKEFVTVTELVPHLHAAHLKRSIKPQKQNEMLDQIFKTIPGENVDQIKVRMQEFDRLVAKLISIDPKDRISADKFISELNFINPHFNQLAGA